MSAWTRIGDRCNKEFFEAHNGFEKPTPIRELVDAGRALTDHNAMQHHVDILYTTLLKG